MSFVIAVPEEITTAASDLAALGRTVNSAYAVAAAPTTGILTAPHNEVSTAIASLSSGYGSQFQSLSTQATAFHAQFVQALNGGASTYGAAEATNASPLQAINAFFLQETGRPLIGNGANGTTVNGVGTAGGAGGWLYGSGGTGGNSTGGAVGGTGGTSTAGVGGAGGSAEGLIAFPGTQGPTVSGTGSGGTGGNAPTDLLGTLGSDLNAQLNSGVADLGAATAQLPVVNDLSSLTSQLPGVSSLSSLTSQAPVVSNLLSL